MTISKEKSDLNKYADYWRYQIGVNVIPADTRNKKPLVEWKKYEFDPVPELQHNQWKNSGAYDKGIAIVVGKVHHREDRKHLNLVFLDCDKKEAILELCSRNGITTPLEKIAEKFVVEQHEDDPTSAHFYFYSEIAFPKKVADAQLGLEVKGAGNHGLAFCTPSVHTNGCSYRITGTKDPIILTKTQSIEYLQHINEICCKYGALYLSMHDRGSFKNMIQTLEIDPKLVIAQGQRHTTLISLADSLLIKYRTAKRKKPENDLKKFLLEVNNKLCKPGPLPESEIEDIWNSAIRFVDVIKNHTSTKHENGNAEGIIGKASEIIMSMHRFVTIQESKEILIYSNGVYITGGEIEIEKEAEKLFGYYLASRHVTEIKGHIMRRTYHKRIEFDSDLNIINLKNGLYFVNTNELKSHSPDYLSVNQKPIIYNSGAKPKIFGKFLKEVLYPQDIRTAVESAGYTFLRDDPHEYIFKLFGYGSNGKTVFTTIMTFLHGSNNISNVPLQEMMKNHFALSDLENKDVNIDTELAANTIKETAVLKKLTSGRRQPVRIERKNQRAYDVYLHAKLFFSANKIPETLDNTDAYYRREVIITFPNRFEGKKADIDLTQKLTSQDELSGIFNVCMIALRNILKNKRIYLNQKTIEERRTKYERSANPTKSFIAEALAEDALESDCVTKEALYVAYYRFCNKHQLPLQPIESLGKDLKKLGLEDGRETRGERKTLWKGIKLVEEYTLEPSQQTLV